MTLHRDFISRTVLGAVVLALLATTGVATRVSAGSPLANGFQALTGPAAGSFTLPSDVQLASTWHDSRHGLTYSRYQQFEQPHNAFVEGGQLTVVQRGAKTVAVVGAHYGSVAYSNSLVLTGTQAVGRALTQSPSLRSGLRSGGGSSPSAVVSRTQLRVDPSDGRLFHRVESAAPGTYVVTEVDAETGAVIESWDALNDADPGHGTGVKGDRKSLLGTDPGIGDNLTQKLPTLWKLQSVDGRIVTYDAGNGGLLNPTILSDKKKKSWHNDNDWAAPYERAAVDAQYYARLTDDWYLGSEGFDMIGDCSFGPIRTVVHYGNGYDNAFWDSGTRYLVFGDGDGVSTGQFSGAQDVVSHELTHRVTECRAPLNYVRQSGALNEAFSDIIATTIEWDANEQLSSNCRRQAGQVGCPDWWVGEDSILSGSPFGFRSIANPALGNQPGHFADAKFLGGSCASFNDYCGVHINSTIPTHAFYLMVNGGRNARCSGPTDPQADCDVVVPSIPLDEAADIAFSGWGMLTESATFCDAHDAMVAAADILPGATDLRRAAVELAWSAVGRGSADCSGSAGLSLSPRSVAVAPGHDGVLQASAPGTTANVALPATTSVVDSQVTVSVPAGMADGIYPVAVTDGTATAYATVIVDTVPPTTSVTSVHLPTGGNVSPLGAVALDVTWSASDQGSGLDTAFLETQSNSWGHVASGAGGTSSVLVGGSSESFRVEATDLAGNDALSDVSGPWNLTRAQEGAATYLKSWSALPSTQNWGSVRFSKTINATATFNFNGTDVSWVSTKSPKRGKAKVYVDGVLTSTIDLFSSSLKERVIVYTTTGLTAGPHTLKIQVLATTGRPRVDIDGVMALTH